MVHFFSSQVIFKGKVHRTSEAKPSKETRGRKHRDGEFSEMGSITGPSMEPGVHTRNEHVDHERTQRYLQINHKHRAPQRHQDTFVPPKAPSWSAGETDPPPTETLWETHKGWCVHGVPLGSAGGWAQVGLGASGKLPRGAGSQGSRHLTAEQRVWNPEPRWMPGLNQYFTATSPRHSI